MTVWVGQRAADAMVLSGGARRVIACQDGWVDGVADVYSLERLTGRREPWSSNDLDACIAAIEHRAPEAFANTSGNPIVPYRPMRVLEGRRDLGRVSANSYALFSELDDNVLMARRLAADGIVDYATSVAPAAGLDFARARRTVGLPFVLKSRQSCSGDGCFLIERPADLEEALKRVETSDVVLSGWLPGTSYNTHGVVAADGTIRTWRPSRQLVGLEGLTSNPLGYCGNVFDDMAGDTTTILDAAVRRLGRWLQGRGYRGAFGADFIVDEGAAHVVDLNPRFQASTALLSMLSVAGHTVGDEHQRAFSETQYPLRLLEPEQALVSGGYAQVVLRNTGSLSVSVRSELADGVYGWDDERGLTGRLSATRLPEDGEIAVLDLPAIGTVVAPGAAMCRCWRRVDGRTAPLPQIWGSAVAVALRDMISSSV